MKVLRRLRRMFPGNKGGQKIHQLPLNRQYAMERIESSSSARTPRSRRNLWG